MGGGGGVRHVTLRALFLQLKGQTGRGGGVLYNIQTLQTIRATALKSWK